ncbi:FAD-dependent oxidoreductase [Glutamicibacter sp. MNS18]|nr:FAD-dependent oxidoreductase [Glutamicibacter sp. MNS18]
MRSNPAELDCSYDVVVVGSGAAGLTAAVRAAHDGLKVAVIEKAALLGGTTAAGGGVIWAPDNHLGKAAGFADSAQAGERYLQAAAGHAVGAGDIVWYVRTASEAVRFLDGHTRVQLVALGRPDYHMEWPGAAHGGRSLDNAPFEAADYPGLVELLRPATYFPLLSMIERDNLNGRAPDPQLLAERAATGVRTMGGALAGSLAASALDLGVVLAVNCPLRALERGATGWELVVGERIRISARAVVLASGGFEFNERLRRAFLPLDVTPIGAPSNEGDGLELALGAGAAITDMTALWGVPVITAAGAEYDGRPTGRMGNVEMTLPGSITVNSAGRRFVNEALNYHDISRVFANIDPHTGRAQNNPAWLVFDTGYLSRYPVAGSTVGEAAGWMLQDQTLAGLAQQAGIDPVALVETVARFNVDAKTGVDTAFGRGSTEQDRHLGDAGNLPNPCLAALDTGPYYAVPLHAGMLGTSGGLLTNHEGQVLDFRHQPLPGLYAAGNVSASVFRNTYPGGGATLGSGVTRAFAVGRHLGRQLAADQQEPALRSATS